MAATAAPAIRTHPHVGTFAPFVVFARPLPASVDGKRVIGLVPHGYAGTPAEAADGARAVGLRARRLGRVAGSRGRLRRGHERRDGLVRRAGGGDGGRGGGRGGWGPWSE